MVHALAAATWLIWENDAKKRELESDEFGEYEDITHLKLQKLLYYAQGISLAIEGYKLFPEKIYAWEHGPVIAEVYDEFKSFGKEPIEIPFTEEKSANIKAADTKDLEMLDLAYDNFAIFTAWQLRNMTHEDGTPWDITVKTKGINAEIDPNLIKDYFLKNVVENE